MKLIKSDMVWGALIFVPYSTVLGWWTILLSLASAFLWALGGQKGHAWRVWGCGICGGLAGLLTGPIQAILMFAAVAGVSSIGYGIPSTQPPDEGSALGRFWFDIFPREADVLTRGTVGCLMAMSFLPILILEGGILLLGLVVLTVGFPVINTYVKGEWKIW